MLNLGPSLNGERCCGVAAGVFGSVGVGGVPAGSYFVLARLQVVIDVVSRLLQEVGVFGTLDISRSIDNLDNMSICRYGMLCEGRIIPYRPLAGLCMRGV